MFSCTNPSRFTVILAVIVAATAMTTIAPQVLAFTTAASSAEELFKTIDRKSEIDPLSDEGHIPATCAGVIEIKDITFAYPSRSDITVLDNFVLSAPAHKTTALVGASGSGKSTIIGLLGAYDMLYTLNPFLTSHRTLVRPSLRFNSPRRCRYTRIEPHLATNERPSSTTGARAVRWYSVRECGVRTLRYRESDSARS